MFIGGTVIPASAYQESPVWIPAPSGGFVPTDIAGCLLWLAADKITGLSDNDPVASWVDSSGSGNNAIQATLVNQPTYKINQLNSLPVLRFEGNNSQSLVSAFSITNRTFFIVHKEASPGFGDGVIDDASITLGAAILRQSTDGQNLYFYCGGLISTVLASPLSWVTVAVTSTAAGSAEMFVNGSSVASGSVGSPATNGFNIGGRAGSSGWSGDFAEIIAYDSVLSGPNIATLQAYINAKYAF